MVDTARRRSAVEAVLGGLAATVGAGVFIAFRPAAGHAGHWLSVAVLLAALVAALNARSVAALRTRFPSADTGYPPCRLVLGSRAGRAAGVLLAAGLTCGIAAASRVFAGYVLPADPRCVAIPMIIVVGVVHLAGVRPSPRSTWIVTSGVFAVLVVVALVGLTTRATSGATTGASSSAGSGVTLGTTAAIGGTPASPVGWAAVVGVLTAAGLLYFAFLGDVGTGMAARSTRLAETVTLVIVLVTYLVVGAAVMHALGLADLMGSSAPLAAAVGVDPSLGVLVRVGAVAAIVSVTSRLFVGAGGAVRAMARRGDLPGWFTGSERRADATVLLAASVVSGLVHPGVAMAMAVGCMLSYFALVNLVALRVSPRALGAALPGMALCVALVVLLPWPQAGLAVGIGVVGAVTELPRPGRVSSVGPGRAAGRRHAERVRPGPRTPCGRRRAGQR